MSALGAAGAGSLDGLSCAGARAGFISRTGAWRKQIALDGSWSNSPSVCICQKQSSLARATVRSSGGHPSLRHLP